MPASVLAGAARRAGVRPGRSGAAKGEWRVHTAARALAHPVRQPPMLSFGADRSRHAEYSLRTSPESPFAEHLRNRLSKLKGWQDCPSIDGWRLPSASRERASKESLRRLIRIRWETVHALSASDAAPRTIRSHGSAGRSGFGNQSARFPDSVANCITSSRAFRTSGIAPAVPSGWKSKIKSLPGS